MNEMQDSKKESREDEISAWEHANKYAIGTISDAVQRKCKSYLIVYDDPKKGPIASFNGEYPDLVFLCEYLKKKLLADYDSYDEDEKEV